MTGGEYLDSEKHGLWVTYYANGNKRSEGRYERGKKQGPWVQYWPNGNKKSEGTFRDDRFGGQYTAYHENGNTQTHGVYNEFTGTSADGTKEGEWLHYEEDGETIWRKITYHRGSRSKPDEILRPRDCDR
jgi:antitoxin component YwqK of YwqJK toxin-antitoxin module